MQWYPSPYFGVFQSPLAAFLLSLPPPQTMNLQNDFGGFSVSLICKSCQKSYIVMELLDIIYDVSLTSSQFPTFHGYISDISTKFTSKVRC